MPSLAAKPDYQVREQWAKKSYVPLTGSQHVGTAGRRAVLGYGAVEEVDVLKERYRCGEKKKKKKRTALDILVFLLFLYIFFFERRR